VGTSDMEKRFHAFGVAVTSSESTDDFLFIFNSPKDCFRDFSGGNEYNPDAVVADCAEAITNAASIAFGEFARVHCWAHVIRNPDKNLDKIFGIVTYSSTTSNSK